MLLGSTAGLSYVDNTTQATTTYDYWVVAVNLAGEGSGSKDKIVTLTDTPDDAILFSLSLMAFMFMLGPQHTSAEMIETTSVIIYKK
ncbi:MAG TPA: hypothetical protein VLH13_01910 [Methanomassiliicoccales archaeon]|nr:hypothetical protein [Methanomassiliicoccales archaeon]